MIKIITAIVIFGLMGCGAKNKSLHLELQGRLAVKGSYPHTYLSIYDEKSHTMYQIQNIEKFNLTKRQNQTVKLEAKLIKEEAGPGFPATIEVLVVK